MRILNLATFAGKIKIRTDRSKGGKKWVPIKTVEDLTDKVTVKIKEVDGTDPLSENEKWMEIEEFIKRMNDSKVVLAVLKKFLKKGYKITMTAPR